MRSTQPGDGGEVQSAAATAAVAAPGVLGNAPSSPRVSSSSDVAVRMAFSAVLINGGGRGEGRAA